MCIPVSNVYALMANTFGDRNGTISHMNEQADMRMPLRYNYDKPEMPRISKGFWDCQACFSSFSKPKNRAAK